MVEKVRKGSQHIRSPKQSSAYPPQDHKLNGSVVVVDLDQDSQQNLSDRVIDLTSMTMMVSCFLHSLVE